MNTLQRHPLSAAWPDMSTEEFAALKADIEVNGLHDPIMLLDGMVLDGWHRYRACTDLLVEPKFDEWPADQDPRPWVDGKNGNRRHLTASQRALAKTATYAYAWAPKGLNQHEVRASATVADPAGKTTGQLAAEAGVSERLIESAKNVITKGAPEVQEAVKGGELPLHEAEKIARRVPKEKQGEAVKRRVAEKKQQKPKTEKKPKETPKPKKAAPAPDPALAEAFGDDGVEKLLEQTQAELKEAQEMVAALEADDQKAETAKWKRIAADAQRKQGELMDSTSQLQRQLSWYSSQLRRIGKAVQQDDPTKVAATVEELARKAGVLTAA